MQRFNGQKFLVAYSGLLTMVFAVTVLGGFMQASNNSGNARFDTITVERINVVEPDGTLRMVLTNNHRVPAIIVHGHEYADFNGRRTDTTAGVFFYDAQATESGGLTFGGRKFPDGTIDRFGHLSFDRYDQDQFFSIDARDDGTNVRASMKMFDQPNWPIQDLLDLLTRIQNLPPDQQEAAKAKFFETHPVGPQRLTALSHQTFPAAPDQNRNALDLFDANGTPRTRLGVNATGAPSLEFLDQVGTVTHTYPPQQ
jgi:hypothetical protein